MSELKYDLKVDPPVIQLEGPFDKKASTRIKIANPGKGRVAIKMKTNNASFRISPSYAFIPPEKDLDVTVSCAGWSSFDPDENYDHRVVTQHANVPEGFEGTPKNFWISNDEHRDITMPVKYVDLAEQFHGSGVIKSFKEHQEIVGSGKNVIVMYGADWCANCEVVKPFFEKLAKEYKDSIQTYRMYDDTMGMENFRKRFSGPDPDCEYPIFFGYKDGDIHCLPTLQWEDGGFQWYGGLEEAVEAAFKRMQMFETMSELEYEPEVEPFGIKLEGPFDNKVSTKIKLTNGWDRVAIKMKTNNTYFRISPSYALIPPEQDLDVTVSCAGWSSFDPDNSYDHRVVVQYAKVPEGFEGTLTEFLNSNDEHNDIHMEVYYGSSLKSDASSNSSEKNLDCE